MKIGIFGGTFDPVHLGHLQLALSLSKIHSLDQVLWIPAKINPLKNTVPEADIHRLEMLKIALNPYPNFKILTLELEREGASFTIDTIRELKKTYTSDQLHLILGDDAIRHFMQWKEPEEIVKIAPPLIGERGPLLDLSFLSPEVRPFFQKGWTKTGIVDISSTEVRDRLKKRVDCKGMAPPEVLDYIGLHHLYCS